MAASHAELSSISSALDDLTKRIGALAEAASEADSSEVAAELFEIERSITNGSRHLNRLVERL